MLPNRMCRTTMYLCTALGYFHRLVAEAITYLYPAFRRVPVLSWPISSICTQFYGPVVSEGPRPDWHSTRILHKLLSRNCSPTLFGTYGWYHTFRCHTLSTLLNIGGDKSCVEVRDMERNLNVWGESMQGRSCITTYALYEIQYL